MALAEENESYVKSAAEKRLALIKSQLIQQTQEDSVIGRQLKAQKRKDLSSQLQPLYAQVELRKSEGGGGGRGGVKPWGGMVAGRSGKTGVSITPKQVNWMTPGWRGEGGGGPGLTKFNTGRTTVVDRAATWTTEGYIDNAVQPREQHRQRVERSGNKGMVWSRTGVDEMGKGIWSGQKVTFGDPSKGEWYTPIEHGVDQKARGEKTLAEKFKQRSKEQASIATVPAPPGIGG